MKLKLISLYLTFIYSAAIAMEKDLTSNAWNESKEHITCLILHGHSSSVGKVIFARDGEKIISCSYDNRAKIWKTQNGVCIYTLLHQFPVESVSIFADLAVTISNNKLISLWNINSGKLLYQHLNDSVLSHVQFSHDGEFFLTNSVHGESTKWTMATHEKKNFIGHHDFIWDSAIARNGNFILTCSSDKTIKQWNPFTADCIHTYTEHSATVSSIDLSLDDHLLASASADKTAKLWDINCDKSVKTLTGHTNHIIAVKLIKNKNILITASTDSTSKIWDINSGICIHTLSGHLAPIRCIAISNDASMLITGSDDHTLKLWDVNSGNCITTLSGHKSRVNSIDISNDGHYIVSGSYDCNVIVWNI